MRRRNLTWMEASLFVIVSGGLLLPGLSYGAIDVAGTLLVDLDARDPSAGTATWANPGSLGDFAEVGDEGDRSRVPPDYTFSSLLHELVVLSMGTDPNPQDTPLFGWGVHADCPVMNTHSAFQHSGARRSVDIRRRSRIRDL